MPHYFSLQYSAIQKTILRHDRLWSISGTSQILSSLNEIDMPLIVQKHNGRPIISSGGKFTASFSDKESALSALKEIRKIISTTLPMLEVQYSDIVEADNLKEALHKEDGNGLINQLAEAKRCFRGYGFTYNPHLQVCDECGEYPAERGWDEDKRLCRICFEGYEKSVLKTNDLLAKDPQSLTSIEKIYLNYLKQFDAGDIPQIPRNFENLFPSNKEDADRQKMAVWTSDINNMGDKVPLWFSQGEDAIPATLQKVTDFNINLISRTLKDVFGTHIVTAADETKYMPFRIIVGGGDDLCVVMRDKDIMRFALGLSKNLHHMLQEVNNDNTHPLNLQHLNSLLDKSKNDKKLKPHSFGGAFVVTPLHTPFKRIHQILELLMKEAKQKTDRQDNSVNWRILSTDEKSVSDILIPFEKPLIIEKAYNHIPDKLSFEDYYEMAEQYRGLSTSHRQQIISKAIEFISETQDKKERGKMLETFLKRMPAASADKESLHNKLIIEERLKNDGVIDISRLCTLFELIGILGV